MPAVNMDAQEVNRLVTQARAEERAEADRRVEEERAEADRRVEEARTEGRAEAEEEILQLRMERDTLFNALRVVDDAKSVPRRRHRRHIPTTCRQQYNDAAHLFLF